MFEFVQEERFWLLYLYDFIIDLFFFLVNCIVNDLRIFDDGLL